MTGDPTVKPPAAFEKYEFDPRYFIHTAKNNITSFGHVVAEAVSNADEAITKRCRTRSEPDRGMIRLTYDPESFVLTITDDGIGLQADEIRMRLRRVGMTASADTRRAFFHRGIREAFIAMGLSTVESIADAEAGPVYSRAVFDPLQGLALEIAGDPVTNAVREQLGMPSTGTRVTIPLARLARQRPHQFTFPRLMDQIESCVQIRPMLQDADREVTFEYRGAPPRRVRFRYPRGEELIAERPVIVGGLAGTLWARLASEPLGGLGRQTRRYGILIRGQRAAYEVSLGTKLQALPVHRQLFGELRLDGIEAEQRRTDFEANDEAQLIYKADRSGLNPDHPIVEAITAFLDDTLGPVLGAAAGRQRTKAVSENVRRQLNRLARIINDVVGLEEFGSSRTPRGRATTEAEGPMEGPVPPEPEPVPERVVDGIEFAYDRVFVRAGGSRTVRVWINAEDVPPGTSIEVVTDGSTVLRAASLSLGVVPPPNEVGISQVNLTIVTNELEGRGEVTVRGAAHEAKLPVHARFPRATGFIRDIIPVDQDWESGSALYDPQSGLVKVYVGRPEFVEIAKLAQKEKLADSFQHPLYKLLFVESAREAALRTAAERRADVAFDDLPQEERQDKDAYARLVTTEYQALDYQLRWALIHAFVLQ